MTGKTYGDDAYHPPSTTTIAPSSSRGRGMEEHNSRQIIPVCCMLVIPWLICHRVSLWPIVIVDKSFEFVVREDALFKKLIMVLSNRH